MVLDAAEQPKQQQQKETPVRRHLFFKAVLFLTVLSIFFVIYSLSWSGTSVFFTATPITTIKTDPYYTVDEEVLEPAEDEAADEVDLAMLTSSCVWNPFNNGINCSELLSQHISAALIRSRKRFLSQQQHVLNDIQFHSLPSILHRRWLLFGDSTMFRLMFQLHQYLMVESVEGYTIYRSTQVCNSDNATADNFIDFQFRNLPVGRCERMEQFQLLRLPTIQEWQLPNHSVGEGPLANGLSNPYCTDCSGCDSEVISCTMVNVSKADRCKTDVIRSLNSGHPGLSYIGPSYSGFLSVEFARDVELQTSEYATTQENLLSSYIASKWNKPVELVFEFGRPNCVVSAGHHDVGIPNITLSVYLQNVQRYLELLVQQCDYIVWISNNAPATNLYEQTVDGTHAWNMAVLDLLLHSKGLMRTNVFFLDVFNASIPYAKDDNIHMSPTWYIALASFIQNIMKNLIE